LKSENDFGGFPSIEEYLKYLWFTMHHSDDPNRQAWAFSVRCYLDESGTHDQSPYTVVAGLCLNRNSFISLGKLWNELLRDMQIKPPVHMKEFGRPNGRLGYLTDAQRYLLFANITAIINSHKVYSIAATMDQKQFKEICRLHPKKEMSSYGMCFVLCAYINHKQAEYKKYSHNIAFLMSEISEHKGQILATHAEMKECQKTNPFHMGSISFDDPINVPALQAADIIAWGVRKRLMEESFNQGFEYIEKIFDENHLEYPYLEEHFLGISQALMKYRK